MSLLPTLGSMAEASEACTLYEMSEVKTSGDLASIMGKHRIFDVDLMMKYDDDVTLPFGEVVLLEHRLLKPQMVIGLKGKNGERIYHVDGMKLTRNMNQVRQIASVKQIVKFCND